MRFVFHAMLLAAFAIVLVGLGCGSAQWASWEAAHVPAHPTLHRGAHSRLPLEATIAPPIAIVPRYGEAVTPGTTLVWRLTEGTDGARVELSRTPDFDPAHLRVIDVDGDRMRLPARLAAGAWSLARRVRRRSGRARDADVDARRRAAAGRIGGLGLSVRASRRPQCPCPGTHTPMTQLLVVQSFAVWQGKAHLPYCVLHRWVPQFASL